MNQTVKTLSLVPLGIAIACVGFLFVKGLLGVAMVSVGVFLCVIAIILSMEIARQKKEDLAYVPTAIDDEVEQLLEEYFQFKREYPAERSAQLYRRLARAQSELSPSDIETALTDTRSGLIAGRITLRSVIASILLVRHAESFKSASGANISDIINAVIHIIDARL